MKKSLSVLMMILCVLTSRLYTQEPVKDIFLINIEKENPHWSFVPKADLSKGALLKIKNGLTQNAIVFIGNDILVDIQKESEITYDLKWKDGNFIIEGIEEELYLPAAPAVGMLKYQQKGADKISLSRSSKDPLPKNEEKQPEPAKKDKSGSESLKYLFIPDPTKENELQLHASKLASCENLPVRKVNYEVVYNFQTGERCYFRNGKLVNTNEKYFRPKEGKELYFSVIDYHPYQDSLAVTVEFSNRNEELGSNFMGLLLQGLNDPRQAITQKGTEGDATDAGAHAIDKVNTPKIQEKFTSFRDEMKAFLLDKKAEPSLSLSFLHLCIKHINRQIQTRFNCLELTPNAIYSAGLAELKGLDPKIQDTCRILLEEGISYYNKIVEYHIHYFPNPIQIKNADVTSLVFSRYKNQAPFLPPSQPLELFNSGGFKIDFSTGLVGHLLAEHQFTTTPDTIEVQQGTPPDVTTSQVVKGRIIDKRASKFSVDAGVFAHFYSRNKYTRRINYSGSIGFAPSKQNDQLRMRYMAGGSVLFGSEQRLVLTAGIIGGNVARLAENLKSGDNGTLIDPKPGASIVVPTRDIFQAQFFVAVTFNFASVSPQ